MMSENKERNLPDQGDRTPRSRREGGTVPATLPSSTNDGLPAPCTSGGAGEDTTEKDSGRSRVGPGTTTGILNEEGAARKLPTVISVETVRPCLKSSKVRTFGGIKPTVASPPPPPMVTDEEGEGRRFLSGVSDTELASHTEDHPNDSPMNSDGSVRTTASGTVKRTKRGNNNAPKEKRGRLRPRRDAPSRALSTSEDEAEIMALTSTQAKKGTRGRPATTGAGILIRQRQAAKKELEDAREQYLQLQKLLEGDFEPLEYKGSSRKRKEAALEEEMKYLPSRDIAAQMVLAARRVEEIANKSGSLKGGFVRQLKEAALNMAVGTDALATRGSPELESTATLRAEISALMEENKKLREERARGWNIPPPSGTRDPIVFPLQDEEMRDASQEGPTPIQDTRRDRDPPRPLPPAVEESEAFPALRPALQGRRRVLRDRPVAEAAKEQPLPRRQPRDLPPPSPSPVRKTDKKGPMMTEEKLEGRLLQFQKNMMNEMSRFFQAVKGEICRPPLPVEELLGKAPLTAKGKEKRRAKSTTSEAATSTKRPPPQNTREETSWARVVGRREKRALMAAKKPHPPPPPQPHVKRPTKAGKKKRIRTPKTAAVSITCNKGEYAEVIAEIRANIPLSTIGLTEKEISMRDGATGATIVEIGGQERDEKADALASAIKTYMAGRDIRVDRPTKTADIRVRGLEVSISAAEVASAVAKKGGCPVQNIRTGEIRRAPRGMFSMWLRLPVAAAKRASEGGDLYVGWSRAKIEVLDARPLRCYRCLERGHTRATCSGPNDRSSLCYRCAGPGHVAKNCTAPPKCPLCTELGRKAGHALGAPDCAPQGRTGRGDARVSLEAAPKAPRPQTSGEMTAGGTGIVPAEETERAKPRRSSRRKTTPPLVDEEERMETDGEGVSNQ